MSQFGNLKTVTFEVAGVSALLMNNPSSMINGASQGLGKKSIPTPEEEAAAKVYKLGSGQLFLPSIMFRSSILAAASGLRIGKKPAKQILAAALFVASETCPLFHPKTGTEITDYEIDVRRAVVQRAAVCRARPLVKEWFTTVEFWLEPELLEAAVVKDIFELAGAIVGIGDYRPQKTGPFGRYTVSLTGK
jgi:hypothetical protein